MGIQGLNGVMWLHVGTGQGCLAGQGWARPGGSLLVGTQSGSCRADGQLLKDLNKEPVGSCRQAGLVTGPGSLTLSACPRLALLCTWQPPS